MPIATASRFELPSALTLPLIKSVKDRLSSRDGAIKSAHLTEAIAAGFGFNTHAALLAAINCPQPVQHVQTPAADDERFTQRLAQLHGQTEVSFAHVVGSLFSMPTQEPVRDDELDAFRTCKSYGVSFTRYANGDVFAFHMIGGCVGPFGAEGQAALAAKQQWSL